VDRFPVFTEYYTYVGQYPLRTPMRIRSIDMYV
jgi:hypothetical protein